MKKLLFFILLTALALPACAQKAAKPAQGSTPAEYSIARHVEISNLFRLVERFYENLSAPLAENEIYSQRANVLLQNMTEVMDAYKNLQKTEPRKVKVIHHKLTEKHKSVFSKTPQNMFDFYDNNGHLFTVGGSVADDVGRWLVSVRQDPAVRLAER